MFTQQPHENPGTDASYGYLSAIYSLDHGYFGGYLIVSSLGRPLEFHCTAPVRPSRAQQILYGPTLHAYLLGEQISGTLFDAAKLTPCLILTDQEAALKLRPRISVPMVLVLGAVDKTPVSKTSADMPPSHEIAHPKLVVFDQPSSNSGSQIFNAANYELRLPWGFAADETPVASLLTVLAQHVDLAEPFGRIHEAIREAQRIGTRSYEGHGQAA